MTIHLWSGVDRASFGTVLIIGEFDSVKNAIADMKKQGVYTENLWD